MNYFLGISFLPFLCLSVLQLVASTSAQTCYYPDGSEAAGNRPCNTSTTYSACCSTTDYCLTNGLCFDAGGNNYMTRDSCTDSSWESNYCPQFCQTSSTSGGESLLACNNSGNANTYCCGVGSNAETCCNNGYSFVVPVGQVIGHPTASTSSNTLPSTTGTATKSSSTPTSSQSQSSVPPSETTQPSSNSKSSATILGLSIGLGIPLSVAFFALLFFLLKERGRQNNLREADRGKVHTIPEMRGVAPGERGAVLTHGGRPIQETGGGERYELPQGMP